MTNTAMSKAPSATGMGALGLLVSLFALNGCLEPPEGEARGPALYETCATCHGADGAGIEDYAAPAIAGLPEWYLLAQLRKFKEGERGAHAEDTNGLRMRGMARTLNNDGDVEAIAAYVAAMPAPSPAPTLGGNAERGQPLYAACVQCHGANAAGNEEREAPPLTSLNDWYIADQLRLFKEGIRGTLEGDESGASMRPMAIGLANEEAMADVAAYIATLRER